MSIIKNMPDSYPLRLIPNKDLKIIIESDLDNSNYLGKWVDSNINLKDPDGKLDPEAIDVDRITGFSTNKIPHSIESDLNIKFDPEHYHLYKKAWVEGEDGIIPESNHFERINDRNHYFIKIEDIIGFDGDYYHPTDKTKPVYKFTVHILHKPTVSNYWHFELAVNSTDHSIKRSDPPWRNRILSLIKDKIQDIAKFDMTL